MKMESDIVYANLQEMERGSSIELPRSNSYQNGDSPVRSYESVRRSESSMARRLRHFTSFQAHQADEKENNAALQLQLRVRRRLYENIALHRKNLGDRLVFESDLFRGFRRLCSQVCFCRFDWDWFLS